MSSKPQGQLKRCNPYGQSTVLAHRERSRKHLRRLLFQWQSYYKLASLEIINFTSFRQCSQALFHLWTHKLFWAHIGRWFSYYNVNGLLYFFQWEELRCFFFLFICLGSRIAEIVHSHLLNPAFSSVSADLWQVCISIIFDCICAKQQSEAMPFRRRVL